MSYLKRRLLRIFDLQTSLRYRNMFCFCQLTITWSICHFQWWRHDDHHVQEHVHGLEALQLAPGRNEGWCRLPENGTSFEKRHGRKLFANFIMSCKKLGGQNWYCAYQNSRHARLITAYFEKVKRKLNTVGQDSHNFLSPICNIFCHLKQISLCCSCY